VLYESPCSLVTIFFSHDHSLSAPAFVCNLLSYLLRLLHGIRIKLPRIIEHGHVTDLVVKCYHATVHEPVPLLCHRLLLLPLLSALPD
jgi:hypothetical protein